MATLTATRKTTSSGSGNSQWATKKLTDYGVTPNSSAAQITAAIHQAQADAANSTAVGGGVLIGPGKWPVTNVIWNPAVSVSGAGRRNTELVGTTSGVVFGRSGETLFDFPGDLRSFTINGNGIADTGLNVTKTAHFNHQDLGIYNCRANGVYGFGCLIGNFDNMVVENCYIGAEFPSQTVGEIYRCNLINFSDCVWRLNKKWAVKITGGSNNSFIANEAGGNGILNDLSTGTFCILDASAEKEGVSVIVTGGWNEGNFGHFWFLGETKHPCIANFTGFTTQLGAPQHGAGYGLYLEGRNTEHRVNLFGCSMNEQVGSGDLYAVGQFASIYNYSSIVGTMVLEEGAMYIDVNGVLQSGVGTGGGGTGGGGTSGPKSLRYASAVKASNPIYYAPLDDAGNSQPAEVGSQAMTITGAALTQQPGPFFSVDAASYCVDLEGASKITVPIDLSPYKAVALEFFTKTDGADSSTNYGSIVEYGSPNWGGKNGRFTLSPFAVPSENSIFGYRIAGGADGTNQRVVRWGTSWYHLVMIIEAGSLKAFMLNGVTYPITTNEPLPQDLPFAPNDLLQFMSGSEPGKLAHVAVYGAASMAQLPSLADFRLHYNA
ncbi:right-handed parallel beta-helix repeat-containing protein [Hymenobacter norwichensis]|uniref:right-handed parallel beta-helix repeat-containing protein n=1 Tax=Hymenobacter norwichensis TaxID=223903 RepID=UPI0003B69168|nr:right-handed parallel beta-helix repeat-containing protein [Hymenobacter norwichensis]